MAQNKTMYLETHRKINQLLLIHSFCRGKSPLVNQIMFNVRRQRKHRHTAEHSLTPIFAKTNSYKYSFFPRSVSEWDEFPPDVAEVRDFSKNCNDCLFTNRHCIIVFAFLLVPSMLPCFYAISSSFFLHVLSLC